MKIYKYNLKRSDSQDIELTKGHEVLSVQVQDSEMCMWVLLDPEAKNEIVSIKMFGTGHEISKVDEMSYIGTVQKNSFVWHFFK